MLQQLLVVVPRTLLGILFLTAAIDGLYYVARGKDLLPAPLSEGGRAFLHNLKDHRLLWGVKASLDLVVALMLIFNFHAPLALLLILPTVVVIGLFQVSINRGGLGVLVLLVVLALAVGAHYAPLYASLLQLQDGTGPLASGPYGHPAGAQAL